jgi:hypothetical protein
VGSWLARMGQSPNCPICHNGYPSNHHCIVSWIVKVYNIKHWRTSNWESHVEDHSNTWAHLIVGDFVCDSKSISNGAQYDSRR